jgi:PAS domain S-box-containing protein
MSTVEQTKSSSVGAPTSRGDFKLWLLMGLLLSFVVPLAGGTYWMYLQSVKEIERRELLGDTVRARTLAAIVQKDLTSAQMLLTSFADQPAFRTEWQLRDFKSINQQIEEVRKLDPAFLFASVYEPDGTLRVIAPADPIVGRNFAYRDWYRGLSSSGKPYVSAVYRTDAGSKPLVVAVVVPIRDDHGNLAGMLMATYSLAELSAKFSSLENGQWQGFTIVDQHGVIAASADVKEQSQPVSLSLSGLVDRAISGEEGSAKVSIDDEKRFVGYSPIRNLGWAALYVRPENQTLVPALHLKRQFRMASLYLLFVYLATASFAVFLLLRQRKLLAANQALNEGLNQKIVEAKEARQELDRYFDVSIDLFCIADERGIFRRVNPAWERLFGWSMEEMCSRPYVDFIHPDDVEATRRQAQNQSEGRQVLSFENRYRCKDGSYRWLEWNATAFHGGKSVYAVARDVTDLKHTQQALIFAKEVAERSTKFKDQFLSMMSHELRTPLNAVLGFSDLLTEERYGPLTDRQKRYLQHIRSGGKHLLRLINDILDLSRIEAGRLQLSIENVRVDGVIAESIDTLNPLANQKTQKLIRQPAPSLSVKADSTRLKQVLMNLIGNAVKFTPEGGKVEVSAKSLGDFVRFDVRDSGPGIAPEEQKRIFEAFYRIGKKDQQIEGTGLGLAITQRLVELHGGQLGIESEIGSGSCFYFTMPAVPSVEVPEVKPTVEIAKSAQDSGPLVLVIEDDQISANLLESQLTAAGYRVEFCFEPNLAVETVARLQPAAVTIDIVMKPVNGWEVLTKLKSDTRTAPVPVIIVSVLDQRATGALLGADEYIVKPVEKSVLMDAVERCVERSSAESRRPILVVEDDPSTREFIAESLTQQGYNVKLAADGEQARAHMASDLPKLVILDLVLPKISGFQLLAEWRINPRTAEVPVFILTSKDLTQNERTYLQANTTTLLQKQERWEDTLFKRLQRTVPVPVGNS